MLLQFAPAASIRQYDWSRKQVNYLFINFLLLLNWKNVFTVRCSSIFFIFVI